MPSDVDERPLDVGKFAVLGDPIPQMRVVRRPKCLQVSARFYGDFFSIHDGGIGKRTDDIPQFADLGVGF